MKACEKFRGNHLDLVELLTTHRHLKCDTAFCKTSKDKNVGNHWFHQTSVSASKHPIRGLLSLVTFSSVYIMIYDVGYKINKKYIPEDKYVLWFFLHALCNEELVIK